MAKNYINSKDKLSEAVKYLCGFPKLSHDTETFNPQVDEGFSALYPFAGGRAFSHVFATAEDEFYFDFNRGGIDRKYLGLLTPIFSDPSRLLYYVNALYDCSILAVDNIVNRCRICDAPSIARVEYNRHGKDEYSDESFLSMDYLAKYYGVQQKNDEVKQYIKEHALYAETDCRITGKPIPLYDKVPTELMFEYGCDDARTTYDLCSKILTRINTKDIEYQAQRSGGKMIDVAKNEIELFPHILNARVEGLKVWTEYVERAIKHETRQEKLLTMEVDLITGGINLRSGKQVGNYLENNGIEMPRKEVTETALTRVEAWAEKAKEFEQKGKTEKAQEALKKSREYRLGNYRADAETLEKLSEKHDLPFLKNIVAAKKANKKVGTYYKNFLLLKDDNDIIHCDLRPETAKTGRFTCRAPNLQNLHKEEYGGTPDEFLIRKSFIANESDELLLFADYSQQEMIVMLDQAEEMSVINKLKSGEFDDFYLATAAVIKEKTGKDITRKQAKAIALGLAYGQGKDLLAASLGCSVEEAMAIKKAFFSALPKLKELDRKLKNDVKIYGKIHNPFGRVTYIPRGKEYVALNSFVQGMSADITKTAIVNCGRSFLESGFKSQFSLCVHDELIFRVKEHELENITGVIESGMVSAYKGKHIQLGVDFEISRRNSSGVSAWGEKVEYEC